MSRLAFDPHEDFQRRIASGDAALRLYAILDAESCERRGLPLIAVAEAWRHAGIRLIQYRDKQGSDHTVLANARLIKAAFEGADAILILNDRVHLLESSGFHGVHVGQTDSSISRTRAIIGPDAVLGVSTHTPDQLSDADETDVTYVAIGPVYGTQTKLDAAPVVGLEGLRTARSLTRKPLVAIGGISADSALSVREAGADSIALISALLPAPGDPLDQAANAFVRLLTE